MYNTAPPGASAVILRTFTSFEAAAKFANVKTTPPPPPEHLLFLKPHSDGWRRSRRAPENSSEVPPPTQPAQEELGAEDGGGDGLQASDFDTVPAAAEAGPVEP